MLRERDLKNPNRYKKNLKRCFYKNDRDNFVKLLDKFIIWIILHCRSTRPFMQLA